MTIIVFRLLLLKNRSTQLSYCEANAVISGFLLKRRMCHVKPTQNNSFPDSFHNHYFIIPTIMYSCGIIYRENYIKDLHKCVN